MKRPMLMVALFYLSGILAADLLQRLTGPLHPAPFLAALALLALANFSLALRRPSAARRLLPATLFVAGFAGLCLHTAPLSPVDLRALAPADARIAEVRGRLLDTPVHRLYTHQDEVTHRTQAEIELAGIRWKDGPWQPAAGRVAISTPGVLGRPYFGGRRVSVEGVLRAPPGPAAPGTFDYAAYLRRRGIHHQLFCDGTNSWRLLESAATAAAVPWADRFGDWAKAMLARGLPVEDQPLQLLWAMTLGWRTALTGEVSEPFMRSGTMHVFAISGLHIALIASLFVALLRVCRVPRHRCALIVIPLLWLYTGATGWQASAIRSTVMMSVIVAGWLLARPSDLLNSLAAAAAIILVWDPQQLFQASFQLSFAVVLSLALIGPVLDRVRLRLFRYDPWIPDELRPGWQRWFRRPIDYLGSSVAVSLAAWLGSLPLVAGYFNLLTPVSLVANLIVVPLSSGALACGLASLIAGPVVPPVGELFNHSAWFFMALMIRASEWAAALPGGCFHVATPDPATVLAFYAALTGLLSGAFHHRRLRPWALTLTLALVAVAAARHVHHHRQSRLTVLPMNGGAALHLAHAADGRHWLIDCGDESSAGFVLKPFLRAEGVNRLDHLLITHGDTHHAGGATVIHGTFPPRAAWLSDVPFRSPAYRDARGLLEHTPGLLHAARPGPIAPPWTVLHPHGSDRFPQADDNAIVLLGQFGTNRVLLLSDLGKPGQNRLLSRHPDLQADIVIAGIPAQSEPLAQALLESVRPRLIIVADVEYPASHRANARLRDRLAAQPVPVLYTRETGALTIRFESDGRWSLDAIRGLPPPGLPRPPPSPADSTNP